MMNFRVLHSALITVLGNAAAGRFRVVGYQGQGKQAEEIKGVKREAQVYYSAGDFPKPSGRQTGPTQHMINFNVDLLCSAPAKANLSAINAPGATPDQIQAALAALSDSANEADKSLDELMDHVYQILMDGLNFDLGLAKGVMSSRWVGRMVKNEPQPTGDLVVVTGQVQYSCQTVEEVTGETGATAGPGAFDTIIDIEGDDVEKTGVTA